MTLQKSNQINIAVFASGYGSNALNIFKTVANQSKHSNYLLKVICVITDQADANVINFAKEYNLPTHILQKESSRQEHEKNILDTLSKYDIDYICLCGYMRILSQDFINQFSEDKQSQIINIHPSLLPKYKGLNSYQRAFEQGETENGVTLHYVDAGVDTGPVIFQKKFPRLAKDTFGDFKQRGMNCEYELYQKFLSLIQDKGRADYVSL